jgi:hypothetical protein
MGWDLGKERRPVEQIEVQVVYLMRQVKFVVVEVVQLSWTGLHRYR